MPKLLSLLSIIFILGSCTSGQEDDKKSQQPIDYGPHGAKRDTVVYSTDTIVSVGNGFSITYKAFSVNGNDEGLIVVLHNGGDIYSDRTDVYVPDDSLNPGLIALGNNVFELFLQVDDRPGIGYLKMLKIQADKVIDSQKLPVFLAKPSHLFNDSRLVYSGVWSDREEWTDSNNNAVTDYDPIMYYVLSGTGLVLDSAETIKRNRKIYGQFNGFDFNEKTPVPVERMKEFREELGRIEKAK